MKVNGQEQPVSHGLLLLDYLKQKGYDPKRVAVEKNGDIVPRAQYGTVLLQPEDTLEIVQFVGGG